MKTLAIAAVMVAGPALAAPTTAEKQRYDVCLSQVRSAPEMAIETANAWRIEGGGVAARHCLALAQMAQQDFSAAIKSFAAAALASEAANDGQAAALWGQAGNAALLAGNYDAAVGHLTTAVAEAAGSAKADPLIDRARAYVELKRDKEAMADLERATVAAPENAFGWLLKATLARRTGDLPLAEAAILEAGRRAPADADVEVEAGNIAAAQGKADLARAAWQAAVATDPDSTAGRAAAKALAAQ